MENGKDLIFHSQREIRHDSDTSGEKRCVLSDYWLSGPPRGILFGASLKLVRTAKNTLRAIEHLKRVQMDFHFNQWDVNHSEVPYEISTFPERGQA